MKNLFIVIELFLAFSVSAFADENTDKMLASALISRQIQQQVNEFNHLVEHVSSVKFETIDGSDIITLNGTVIRGGDIACGHASLVIKKSTQPGFGFNVITVYEATVSKELSSSSHCR